MIDRYTDYSPDKNFINIIDRPILAITYPDCDFGGATISDISGFCVGYFKLNSPSLLLGKNLIQPCVFIYNNYDKNYPDTLFVKFSSIDSCQSMFKKIEILMQKQHDIYLVQRRPPDQGLGGYLEVVEFVEINGFLKVENISKQKLGF